MKRFGNVIKTITAIITAVVITVTAIPYATTRVNAIDTSNEAEQALEDKISTLQDEQTELKAKLEAAAENEAEQEKQKEYLDSLVMSTQNEIEATKQLITEYDQKIENKNVEIKNLEEKIDTKYGIMLQRLRFTYEEGNASYLEMILGAESFTDFLMTVERVGNMLDYDRTLMNDLQTAMENLELEKTALVETQQAQEKTKENLIQKESDLQTQISQTEAYIAELQADQEALEAEYLKAKAAEEKANAEIQALLAQRLREQQAAASRPSTSVPQYDPQFGGKFIWPVPGYSTISSYYGPRTLWGRYDFHLGIDIPAPSGTNIYASAAGVVVTATYHYSYGYYVLVDHGNGYATLYAHCSQLCVSAGQSVAQGQVVGRVGTTGSSSGNHLHFEVRINGSTVDPTGYVAP